MRAALALARRNLGQVWPNPAVGCVIVKESRVVGRGWTRKGGRPHAETEALAQAGAAARGATAFVSLEPCSHHGKTPPCADALIAAGVPVVHTRYMGMNHGFARKLVLFDAARAAADQVASSLRAALTF